MGETILYLKKESNKTYTHTHNTIVVLNSEMLIKKHQGTFKNAR